MSKRRQLGKFPSSTPVLPRELRGLDLTNPHQLDEVARRAREAALRLGGEVSRLLERRLAPWARCVAEDGVDPASIWVPFAAELRAVADGLDPPGP